MIPSGLIINAAWSNESPESPDLNQRSLTVLKFFSRELSSQNNTNTDSMNTDLSNTDYTIINTAPPPKPSTDIGPKKSSCNMCGADFASKTKLFAHLKETGHAIKKEFVQKPAGNKKGKKGEKR